MTLDFDSEKTARSTYYKLLKEFERSQRIELLLQMLGILPRIIDERIAGLEARLDELAGEVKEVSEIIKSIIDINDKFLELNRKVDYANMSIGALAEAMLSRLVSDELKAEGYTIRRYERNYSIDGEEI